MIVETRSACESPESAKDLLLAAKMWRKMHAIVKVSEHSPRLKESSTHIFLIGLLSVPLFRSFPVHIEKRQHMNEDSRQMQASGLIIH